MPLSTEIDNFSGTFPKLLVLGAGDEEGSGVDDASSWFASSISPSGDNLSSTTGGHGVNPANIIWNIKFQIL